MSRSQFQQIRSATSDELLVGGNYGFARLQCFPNYLLGWAQSANQLDHDIGVRVENRSDVLSPDHVLRNPILLLSLDVAIKDVSELQGTVMMLTQNLGNGTADRPKSHERNAASGASLAPLLRPARSLHHRIHRYKLNSL